MPVQVHCQHSYSFNQLSQRSRSILGVKPEAAVRPGFPGSGIVGATRKRQYRIYPSHPDWASALDLLPYDNAAPS